MERSFLTIQPESWVAWSFKDQGYFLGQIHGEVFEIPAEGKLVGVWHDKPSEDQQKAAITVAEAGVGILSSPTSFFTELP